MKILALILSSIPFAALAQEKSIYDHLFEMQKKIWALEDAVRKLENDQHFDRLMSLARFQSLLIHCVPDKANEDCQVELEGVKNALEMEFRK